LLNFLRTPQEVKFARPELGTIVPIFPGFRERESSPVPPTVGDLPISNDCFFLVIKHRCRESASRMDEKWYFNWLPLRL
jgi:hypothetical protein